MRSVYSHHFLQLVEFFERNLRMTPIQRGISDANAAVAETLARAAEEVFRTEDMAGLHSLAQVALAQSLLAQGKVSETEALRDDIVASATSSAERRVQLATAIVVVQLGAVRDKTPPQGRDPPSPSAGSKRGKVQNPAQSKDYS